MCSKYPVGEMFRQDDLSQFFLGNSGTLKRQNEQRTQYFKDYEKSNSVPARSKRHIDFEKGHGVMKKAQGVMKRALGIT
jgi:hypothetical protein